MALVCTLYTCMHKISYLQSNDNYANIRLDCGKQLILHLIVSKPILSQTIFQHSTWTKSSFIIQINNVFFADVQMFECVFFRLNTCTRFLTCFWYIIHIPILFQKFKYNDHDLMHLAVSKGGDKNVTGSEINIQIYS